jgi:hypothetical protein
MCNDSRHQLLTVVIQSGQLNELYNVQCIYDKLYSKYKM